MTTSREMFEYCESEGLKNAVGHLLRVAGGSAIGQQVIEAYAFGVEGRPQDPRLNIDVAGVAFETPVLVGAGWDKDGRYVDGLHALGFAGVEIGTVTPFAQPGNPRPRMWTMGPKHGVAINRMGFNSPGVLKVEEYLDAASPLPCPIGINVGRNKLMPNDMAPWAHSQVISRLGKFASYIALGISSPNTPNLRGLQDEGPFRELIQSAMADIGSLERPVPLFVKIDGQRSRQELDGMIEVGVEEGLDGFVAINTYSGGDLKAKYGKRWPNEPGGLSGADSAYQDLAIKNVRHIYEQAGDKLAIFGVGGVDGPESALRMMRAGASAVQVVTAMRSSFGKVAARTNRGLVEYLDTEGFDSIRDIVGIDTDRGLETKAA